MTIEDLINELSCFPKDKEVVLASPSGDFWGTIKALGITNVEVGNVTWSAYHNTDKIVDDDRLDRYEKDELKEVVILS